MEFSHEELQFAASALGLRAEATWCKWLVTLGISLVRIVILMHDALGGGTAPSHELKGSLTDFTRFRYNIVTKNVKHNSAVGTFRNGLSICPQGHRLSMIFDAAGSVCSGRGEW